MNRARVIWALVRKETLLELRRKYALTGLMVYTVSMIFVCYMAFNARPSSLNTSAWNALYWIILLFTCINAVGKSFVTESRGQFHYYYQLASPVDIILAKIVSNGLLLLALTASGTLVYFVILGNRVSDPLLFVTITLLAASGLSGSLTLVSAIAGKAGNNSTLMAVLSLPILIPLLVMMVKAAKNAIDGIDRLASMDEIITLFALNLIVLALSVVLFPYLWKN